MRDLELLVATASTAVGTVLVAGTEMGISAALLGDHEDALRADVRRRFPGAVLRPGTAAFQAKADAVAAYIDDPRGACPVPLDPRGTPFQRQVWAALRQVPAGQTTTYADLARQLGRPGSARAVGQAVGANPLAVMVPCHRVIRSDGGISGFRWGVARKRELLAREGVVVRGESEPLSLGL